MFKSNKYQQLIYANKLSTKIISTKKKKTEQKPGWSEAALKGEKDETFLGWGKSSQMICPFPAFEAAKEFQLDAKAEVSKVYNINKFDIFLFHF